MQQISSRYVAANDNMLDGRRYGIEFILKVETRVCDEIIHRFNSQTNDNQIFRRTHFSPEPKYRTKRFAPQLNISHLDCVCYRTKTGSCHKIYSTCSPSWYRNKVSQTNFICIEEYPRTSAVRCHTCIAYVTLDSCNTWLSCFGEVRMRPKTMLPQTHALECENLLSKALPRALLSVIVPSLASHPSILPLERQEYLHRTIWTLTRKSTRGKFSRRSTITASRCRVTLAGSLENAKGKIKQ